MNRHVKDLIIAGIVVAVVGLIMLGMSLTGTRSSVSLEERLATCNRLERQAQNSYGYARDEALLAWSDLDCRHYKSGE